MGIIVRRSMNERRKVEVRSKLFDKLRKQYLLVCVVVRVSTSFRQLDT